MQVHRVLVWAALAALCIWGGMAWCTPLGPKMPEPQTPVPLDGPMLSPQNALDRELFGQDPGQIKAIPPAPGKAEPEALPRQRPASGSPAPATKDPLPAPPGLLPEPVEPAKPAGAAKPAGPPAAPPQDLSAVSEADNPLVDIARRMREAERLLAQANSGQKTQELQDGILRDLDALLKQVQAQCRAARAAQGQCQSPGTAERKADNPSPQSSPRPVSELPKERSEKKLGSTARTAERPTHGRNPQADAKQRASLVRGAWGSLPERQRQQMMQLLPPEQFLPKYESMIEEYYRRLGEENGHARP